MPIHPLEKILHPRSIAVVGASANARGPNFIEALCAFGFKGPIYPVNPKYQIINEMKAYPSVKAIPEEIDYVISSIPAAHVLNMIDDCAKKGVKTVHLFTARFSETGRKEAAELELEILKRAREGNVRLIGPNCMGVYYPEHGMSFTKDMPKESGSVGLISQSGSAVHDIVNLAAHHGVHFSKAISYGNALDFNECDYLEYLAQDPKTKLILIYIEGVRDGKRFLKVLRQTLHDKPVIILKGGRGKSGARATVSHTASLAGSMAVWESAIRQTGAISVRHLDELVDVAMVFYYLDPIFGKRVGVAGGAGGSSVLAADLCEEAGLDVIPFPEEIRNELKAKGNPIWDWIGNPVDMSIRMDRSSTPGETLKIMAANPDFDLLITFIHTRGLGNLAELTAETLLTNYSLDQIGHKPLLGVIEGDRFNYDDSDLQAHVSKILDKALIELRTLGIPVFPTIERAALAANKMITYYKNRANK